MRKIVKIVGSILLFMSGIGFGMFNVLAEKGASDFDTSVTVILLLLGVVLLLVHEGMAD
jgi:uncharacterized membrane protein